MFGSLTRRPRQWWKVEALSSQTACQMARMRVRFLEKTALVETLIIGDEYSRADFQSHQARATSIAVRWIVAAWSKEQGCNSALLQVILAFVCCIDFGGPPPSLSSPGSSETGSAADDRLVAFAQSIALLWLEV